jgi:hypothetical protein
MKSRFEAGKERIKRKLFRHLKKAHAFWSYDPRSVVFSNMDDDFLIEKVLYHLDMDDIDLLFSVYSKKKIKEVWKHRLCPRGEYCLLINRLYAYILFDVKNPDRYIKIQQTKFINKKFKNYDNRLEKSLIP